ncbi:MAG: threonylcarbamoyl-AMP synthase [Lachnospiraceae bacterium]|nr:threonylcarbamoyl-AMP synthase [Lachnospiraceae bacterium]
MDTVIRKISQDITQQEYEYIKEAGEIIRAGGLVAFPTETVYGLGGNALDKNASARIYAAKGRPSDNPLIVHISDMDMLDELAKDIPEQAYALATLFWPGPLTIVLKKKDIIPDETTGGLDTVAIRMPDNDIALSFIKEAKVPIAAPSANLSGRPSTTTALHVWDDLSGRIDMILDGGAVDIGVESTIVDLTDEEPVILRPGYVNEDMLKQVCDTVLRDQTLDDMTRTDIKPKAPGMKYRHYAPTGELVIVSGDAHKTVEKINELARQHDESVTAVVTTEENKDLYNYGKVICIGTRKDPLSISHSLYDVLRQMDDYGMKYIYMEAFYDNVLGDAIMNRLKKASGGHIIYV